MYFADLFLALYNNGHSSVHQVFFLLCWISKHYMSALPHNRQLHPQVLHNRHNTAMPTAPKYTVDVMISYNIQTMVIMIDQMACFTTI